MLDDFLLKISNDLKARKGIEPREYALEISQNKLLISLLIQ